MLSSKEIDALKIIKILRKNSFKAYYVGGIVRDKLLNLPAKDIDIVTSAKPNQIKLLFKKTLNIGAKYGIILVIMNRHSFEVSSFRRDLEYKDGRHPENIEFSDEKHDALRRDFTINGLFLDPISQKLIDYVHGQKDLYQQKIRAIGNPKRRFQEDKLRMLRAVRFATQLNYHIEKRTWLAIKQKSNQIIQVSMERIRDELFKIFIQKNLLLGINLLIKSNLLLYIFPETSIFSKNEPKKKILFILKKTSTIGLKKKEKKALFIFSLIVNSLILHKKIDHLEKTLKKFKLSNKEIKFIQTLLSTKEFITWNPYLSEANFARLIQKGHFLYALKVYQLESLITKNQQNILLYKTYRLKYQSLKKELKSFKPFIQGKDLILLGLKPSIIFKAILYEVETRQLEKKLTSKKEALLWIKQIFIES